MQEGTIKAMTQLPDGSPIQPKGILSKWHNDCSVLVRKNVRLFGLIGVLFLKKRKKLYGN
jgi:hypothetical protein